MNKLALDTMEDIDPKFLDVPHLQITPEIIRFHGMNPGGSWMNGNNNFLIGSSNSRILIDWGASFYSEEQSEKFVKSLTEYIQENNITISHILITHHHYDHLGNLPALISKLQTLSHDTSKIEVRKRLYDYEQENDVWEKVKDQCQVKNLEDSETITGEGI